jgi:hypothetical protein
LGCNTSDIAEMTVLQHKIKFISDRKSLARHTALRHGNFYTLV